MTKFPTPVSCIKYLVVKTGVTLLNVQTAKSGVESIQYIGHDLLEFQTKSEILEKKYLHLQIA